MADISLIAAVDATQFNAGLDQMKNATQVKSRAMVSELEKIAAAEARINKEVQRGAKIAAGPTGNVRGGAFGGRNTGYIGGQLAMQMQDVAVMAQMGASTSRIIAQQGSQILSIFGPGGAIAGGVLAIGAAIGSWALGTEKADKAARALEAQWAAITKQTTKVNKDIEDSEERIIRLQDKRLNRGADAEIEQVERVLAKKEKAFRDENAELIRLSNQALQDDPVRGSTMRRGAFGAMETVAEGEMDFKTRQRNVRASNQAILDARRDVEAGMVQLKKEAEEEKLGIAQRAQEKEFEEYKKAESKQHDLDKKAAEQKAKDAESLLELSELRGRQQQQRKAAEIAALGKSGAEIMAADAEKGKKDAIQRGTEQIRAINDQQARAAERVGMTGGQEKAERAYNRAVDRDDRKRAAREAEKLDREGRKLGRDGLTPEQRKEVRDAALRQIKGARDRKASVALEEESIKQLVQAIEKLQVK